MKGPCQVCLRAHTTFKQTSKHVRVGEKFEIYCEIISGSFRGKNTRHSRLLWCIIATWPTKMWREGWIGIIKCIKMWLVVCHLITTPLLRTVVSDLVVNDWLWMRAYKIFSWPILSNPSIWWKFETKAVSVKKAGEHECKKGKFREAIKFHSEVSWHSMKLYAFSWYFVAFDEIDAIPWNVMEIEEFSRNFCLQEQGQGTVPSKKNTKCRFGIQLPCLKGYPNRRRIL